MHQDKCAASPASKQENGEKHTEGVYITFYSRCHEGVNFVHSKTCFMLEFCLAGALMRKRSVVLVHFLCFTVHIGLPYF